MRRMRSGLAMAILLLVLCTAARAADTVHVGDLVIDSQYVIENQTYEQEGNIIVLPGGELVLRNATLLLDQGWHGENQICLQGDASLSLEGATISSQYAYLIYLSDTSTLTTEGETGLHDAQLFLAGQASAVLKSADLLHANVSGSAVLEANGCQINEITSSPATAGPWLSTPTHLNWCNIPTACPKTKATGAVDERFPGRVGYWT